MRLGAGSLVKQRIFVSIILKLYLVYASQVNLLVVLGIYFLCFLKWKESIFKLCLRGIVWFFLQGKKGLYCHLVVIFSYCNVPKQTKRKASVRTSLNPEDAKAVSHNIKSHEQRCSFPQSPLS